jgi:hypothetical protein
MSGAMGKSFRPQERAAILDELMPSMTGDVGRWPILLQPPEAQIEHRLSACLLIEENRTLLLRCGNSRF